MRSSCEASARNRRSRSSLAWRSANASSSRSSIEFRARPEAPDLRSRGGRADAAREIPGGDRPGGVAHAVQRAQPESHDEEGDEAHGEQDGADHERLDESESGQRLIDLVQRHGRDGRVRRERVGRGDDAVAQARAALRVHGDHLVQRQTRRQVGRGRSLLAVGEDDVAEDLPGSVPALAVGAGRQVGGDPASIPAASASAAAAGGRRRRACARAPPGSPRPGRRAHARPRATRCGPAGRPGRRGTSAAPRR